MGTIKSYRDLIVWNKSIEFVKTCYRHTGGFPESENFGLSGQIRRSAVSIPSNIAEGYSRNTTKEYLQFLFMARGSCAETDTQLYIAHELGYLSPEKYRSACAQCEEVGRMLNGLIRKLKYGPQETSQKTT